MAEKLTIKTLEDHPAVIAYLQGVESDLDVSHEGSRR